MARFYTQFSDETIEEAFENHVFGYKSIEDAYDEVMESSERDCKILNENKKVVANVVSGVLQKVKPAQNYLYIFEEGSIKIGGKPSEEHLQSVIDDHLLIVDMTDKTQFNGTRWVWLESL